MSRYIDKDSAIDLSISVLCGGGNEEMAVLVEDINSAPTIEIIRCRECKYWNMVSNGCMRNPSVEGWQADDFCSYGCRDSEKPNKSETPTDSERVGKYPYNYNWDE